MAYTITARAKYVDKDGNYLPVLPVSLNINGDDVAGNKVTIDEADGGKAYSVLPLPGTPEAYGVRFQDVKQSAAGAATTKLNLVIGGNPSTLTVREDILANAAIAAHDRMQGLDDVVFAIGQTIGFIQKA